jgi:hypothetical protein
VLQVLRIEGAAAGCERGGHDEAVIEAISGTPLDLQCTRIEGQAAKATD